MITTVGEQAVIICQGKQSCPCFNLQSGPTTGQKNKRDVAKPLHYATQLSGLIPIETLFHDC